MAIGPYLDVATASFHDVDLGGGAEWLLPVRDDLPLVLSAGAFWRNGDDRSWSPGMEGTVFFGSRSYNFHSWYGLAAGLFAQSRWIPSSPSTLDLVFGVQIDGELLVLPALLIYEAIRCTRARGPLERRGITGDSGILDGTRRSRATTVREDGASLQRRAVWSRRPSASAMRGPRAVA